MPTISNTTLEEVLERFAMLVRDNVPGADDSTCVVADDADTLPSPLPDKAGFIWLITPDPNFNFDDAAFDGGGVNQCTVETTIVVTIWVLHHDDRAGEAVQFFTNPHSGMFSAAVKPVLKAVSGQVLERPDSVQILNQPIFPAQGNWQRPARRRGNVQLAFRVNFDYDLS